MFASQNTLLLLPAHKMGGLWRRHPLLILLAAGCLLSLCGWAGGYWYFHVSLWKARQAFRLDLLPEASAAVNAYLEGKPNDVEAHLLASRIGRLQGNFPAVEKHLQNVKRLEGSTERSQVEWLLLRAVGGELASVELGLKVAVEKNDPNTILILEGLVFSYMKDMRYGNALYYVDKWLQAEPDCVRALSWRGWIREEFNYTTGARDDYSRVLELSPNHLSTRLRLVNILLIEKNIPEAGEHLRILERDAPENPEVIYDLAQCRAFEGESEEARKLLDHLLGLQPKNARALHQRGNLALDDAEKEKWFRKALAIDLSYHEARYSLFTCLQKQPNRKQEADAEKKKYLATVKNWQTLKKTLDELERTPNNPDLLAAAGKLLLARNPIIAQEFLQKALAVSPGHQNTHKILADYFEETNQPEKAAFHQKRLSSPQ
jgi:tetratricopeptide (TPR) repeat protein